jgi:hypothetical protein
MGVGGGVKRTMLGGNAKIFGGSVRIPEGRVRIVGKLAGGCVRLEGDLGVGKRSMAGGSVNRMGEGQRTGSAVSGNAVVVSMDAAPLIADADWCWVTIQNKEHRKKHFILK